MSYTVEREIIIETKTIRKEMKNINDWKGHSFESSSGKTPEFMAFTRMFRAAVKKQVNRQGLILTDWNDGHFYCSAFIHNPKTNKYAYISTDDVRGSNRWHTDILVRTATGPKDYTGGSNNFSTFDKLGEELLRLTE